MNPLVNQLIQLQELILVKEEQKVAVGGHSEELEASIRTMMEKLPSDVHERFKKLHTKDHIFITPVADGGCAVCRMRLPISLVQSVKGSKDVHNCPQCARMLYFPEAPPRRVGKAPSRTEPPKVGISRFSSHSLMIPNLEATDAEGAIREMATTMAREGFVDGVEKLVEHALQREAIVSTAVDHGLAFPHVRGVEGGGLTLACGLSRKGIPFGEEDKKPTKILFFMVIPTAASAFYLKLLAGLAESFTDAENRKAVLAAKDQDELWKALSKVTRATIK